MLILSGCCMYMFSFLVGSIPFRGRASPRGCVPVSAYYRRPLRPSPAGTHTRTHMHTYIRTHARTGSASMSIGIYNTRRKCTTAAALRIAPVEDQLSRLIVTSCKLILPHYGFRKVRSRLRAIDCRGLGTFLENILVFKDYP